MFKMKSSKLNEITNKIITRLYFSENSNSINKNIIHKNVHFLLNGTNPRVYAFKNNLMKNLINSNKRFFSEEVTQNNESQLDLENTRDLLLLTKPEKVFAKVLLRNIRYYDKNPFSLQEKNKLYDNISNKLISTFNFAEENQDINDHYLIDENNVESNIIYSSPKSFYVDWMASNLALGQFVLKIRSQSKNIIFEDLFNDLANIKDENSLFVLNIDKEQSEHELISDSEEIAASNKFILDYPKELYEENKERKFDLVYNFDKNKPNQLLFFCEKLFVNDIISAEELSEIKRLAFISGRNLKYTQNQNLSINQYEDLQEALHDLRIMEKLERIPDTQHVSIKFDLNLNHLRPDHNIDTKLSLKYGFTNQVIYVITDKDSIDLFSKIAGVSKVDSGEFFAEFTDMISKNNYKKNHVLFIENKNLELISSQTETYVKFLEIIGSNNTGDHIKFNDDQIIKEISDFREHKFPVRLNNNNSIEIKLGDLSFSNENLIENFKHLKTQIMKLQPKTVKKNFIKNVSLFVNDVELRLKNKE